MRDIRNERTEKAIADAFLEELASKPFADIYGLLSGTEGRCQQIDVLRALL